MGEEESGWGGHSYSYNNCGIGIITSNSQVVKLRSRKVKQLFVWAYVVIGDPVDKIHAH